MAGQRRGIVVGMALLGLSLLLAGCDDDLDVPTTKARPGGKGAQGSAASANGAQRAKVLEPVEITPFESEGASAGFTLDMGQGVTMDFIRLGRGSFVTGGGSGGIALHKVRIDRPFCLGKCEVTQEQWNRLMAQNPSLYPRPQNPVNRVTWTMTQEFLSQMNARFGQSGRKFRLPTEDQWEYACRAGGGTSGYGTVAGSSIPLKEVAWYGSNAKNEIHPVGEKKPNAWGFHDMLGNVREFCADDPDMPTTVRAREPNLHAVRGGGYHDGDCSPTSRELRRDVVPFLFDGLRVACFEK